MGYIPTNDDQFRVWLTNLNEKASFYAATLGLSGPELAPLETATTNFTGALSDWQLANLTARSARANKEDVRSSATRVARTIAQLSRNAPGATDSILIDMGLTPKDGTQTSTPPKVPVGLVAVGLSTGENQLKWKRNGNLSNTQYVVQARSSTSTPWEFVGVTTKTTYVQRNQIPGQVVYYRIYAQRAEQQSAYSNEAIVYGPGGTQLSIAA